jgi:hypothetical protein
MIAVIGVCAAGALGWHLRKTSSTPPTAKSQEMEFVIISGDTAGWITPCGCTANQSGGLPRRGQLIEATRDRENLLYADVGGAPAGTSAYQRVKFEAILRGELLMGLAAHNLGGPELDLGIDYLRNVGRELQVPFISANARDDQGKLIGWPLLTGELNGRRVAFVGVVSRRFAHAGMQIDDPLEAARTVIADNKGKYDSVIVLAYVPEDELRSLAAALPEADAVVGGPTGQSIAPESIGPTLLAAATNKGKFVLLLTPIRQRWTGSVFELKADFPDESRQIANINCYLADLASRDFTAAETGFAPPLPPGLPAAYRIAGSDSCKNCHQTDCTSWAASKHAHAWETLTAKGYHVDGYCQQCHTTGFGLPGGFVSAKRSPERVGVGCESCHGPSDGHVKDPKVRTPFAARDQCVRCHDHENSPTFEYGPYWEKVRHGKK